MKRAFFVAAVAALSITFAFACSAPAPEGEAEAVTQEQPADQEVAGAKKVEVTVLPLPGKCVTIDGLEFCDRPGANLKLDLPAEVFEITVDGQMYTVDSYDGENSLEEVYVLPVPLVLGVYSGGKTMEAAKGVCSCIQCPSGAIVCGCNPQCPPMR